MFRQEQNTSFSAIFSAVFAHFFAVFMPGQKKTQPGSHILRLPGKRHLRMAFQKHVLKCTFWEAIVDFHAWPIAKIRWMWYFPNEHYSTENASLLFLQKKASAVLHCRMYCSKGTLDRKRSMLTAWPISDTGQQETAYGSTRGPAAGIGRIRA